MPSSTVQYSVCDLSQAKARPAGDISSVFASFTKDTKGMNDSYIEIKKQLIKDPAALKASWLRVKKALQEAIIDIKQKGSDAIPQIDFNDINNLSEEKAKEIRKTGCMVIKGVVPKEEAEGWKQEVIDYIEKNPQTNGFPKENKVVYELYWSKSQIKARSNPNLRSSMNFANKLWHASPDSRISLQHNVMYADRLRIRQPGDALFALGPHADGGSIERWEDPEYSLCYKAIFDGKWEEYDAFDATHRVNADMERYDGAGACSIFRSFQAWLAVSRVAPKEGTILFAPLIREVTAYWILKPFFDSNDDIKFDNNFPGAFAGKGQEFSDETHPELNLEDLMVPVPTVEPGDMVYWHCDTIHAVDAVHQGKLDSSVFYIPSAPLCDINLKYSFTQRESFLKGLTPPDFPGFPHTIGESTHIGRATPDDVFEAGGDKAMQEFALLPILIAGTTKGEQEIIADANEMLFV